MLAMTEQTQKTKRSFFLKALVVAFLIQSWMGWLRLIESISNWDLLTSFKVQPSPLYLAVSGGAWGILGLAAALGLWVRWRWAAWAARIIVLLSSAWYWIDRFVLGISPERLTNVPFAAVINLLAILFAFAVLSISSARVQKTEKASD
jgi:hypothetical protein